MLKRKNTTNATTIQSKTTTSNPPAVYNFGTCALKKQEQKWMRSSLRLWKPMYYYYKGKELKKKKKHQKKNN